MKRPSKPKGVIFDMDGVILDNNEWHVASWLVYAQKLGIDLKREEFPTRVFGKTNEEILLLAFPTASNDQLLQWSLEKEALYRQMYQPHFELTPGLLSLLENLKTKNVKLAVASNAPKVNVDFALNEGKIRSFFQSILFFGIVPNPKPAPDIYLESARRLQLLPADCYVIEDSPTGIQAAVAAGCTAIGITTTYPRKELESLTPWVFDQFSEIQDFLV